MENVRIRGEASCQHVKGYPTIAVIHRDTGGVSWKKTYAEEAMDTLETEEADYRMLQLRLFILINGLSRPL
jgi:hypothetical protein